MPLPRDNAPIPATRFIAANGYTGFRSHYDAAFRTREHTHLYTIKGGPGTGKSHLMRALAKQALARGLDVTQILCSSDPDSLDGVILQRGTTKVSILDGTAPHERGTQLPGAADDILDLGQFWDSHKLAQERDTVQMLSDGKQECYRRAYRFLGIAGRADAAAEEMLSACLLTSKLQRAAARFLHGACISPAPGEERYYLDAFSMKGYVTLPAPWEGCRTIYLSDHYDSARFLLRALHRILQGEGVYAYTCIPSCLDDGILRSIYLPHNNLLFAVDKTGPSDKTVHMQRFLDLEGLALCRTELRTLRHIRQEACAAATAALQEAGSYHFALERLYGEAMDFAAKEAYSAEVCAQILAWFDV